MKMVVAMALLAFSGLRRQLLCTSCRRSRSFGEGGTSGGTACGDSNFFTACVHQCGETTENGNPSWLNALLESSSARHP